MKMRGFIVALLLGLPAFAFAGVGDGPTQSTLGPSSVTATAAGTTQGTCAPITAQVTIFTNVGAGTGGCLAAVLGQPQTVINQGLGSLTIYPFPGAAIGPNATNAGVTVPAGDGTIFRCLTNTQCYGGM
jgi:hypothetical protein